MCVMWAEPVHKQSKSILMTQAYFNNLADQLCFQLSKAKNNISAAVCWFSHANIFDVLKKKF